MYRSHYLEQFYAIDPDTNQYTVEIAIQHYDDIFNTWDSSVYNIRDLNGSLKAFLEECSRDIALKHDVVLRFNVRGEERDAVMEQNMIAGMRNYFNYQAHVMRNHFITLLQRVTLYTVLALLLITISLLLGNVGHNLTTKVLVQVFSIGGWIFLWETFSFIFIRSGDLRKKRREYTRLDKSPIVFKYHALGGNQMN